MSAAPATRLLQAALFAAGFFLLGWWFHGWYEARRFQSEALKSLEQERARPAADSAGGAARSGNRVVIPARGLDPAPDSAGPLARIPTPRRGVIGRLDIPRLGISAVIVEGTTPEVLDRAIGHFPFTALPGQRGNVGLAGHRDTFLRGLGGIREDDLVVVTTRRKAHRYRVREELVVDPERVDVLNPTPEPSVTLVTCYPFNAIGPAPQRFIVRATLEDAAAAR